MAKEPQHPGRMVGGGDQAHVRARLLQFNCQPSSGRQLTGRSQQHMRNVCRLAVRAGGNFRDVPSVVNECARLELAGRQFCRC